MDKIKLFRKTQVSMRIYPEYMDAKELGMGIEPLMRWRYHPHFPFFVESYWV